ncbi:MAG: hypothetical protein V3R81_14215, partial [Gammaproteobacteria bacterium]
NPKSERLLSPEAVVQAPIKLLKSRAAFGQKRSLIEIPATMGGALLVVKPLKIVNRFSYG